VKEAAEKTPRMHGQPSSLVGRTVAALAALLMFGAAAGMFFF
jgi:hypothetical protein